VGVKELEGRQPLGHVDLLRRLRARVRATTTASTDWASHLVSCRLAPAIITARDLAIKPGQLQSGKAALCATRGGRR
jgi:hypothetical protein